MHHAVVAGGEGQARVFKDRQGIDVPTHRDRRRTRLTTRNPADDARAGNPRHVAHAEPDQRLLQARGGPLLLERKLGVGVERTAQTDEFLDLADAVEAGDGGGKPQRNGGFGACHGGSATPENQPGSALQAEEATPPGPTLQPIGEPSGARSGRGKATEPGSSRKRSISHAAWERW